MGRVDFLIGNRLVIEVDGKAYHTGDEAFRRDRRRDRSLVRMGYLIIRVTYEEVIYEWDTVEQDILTIIRSGEHRHVPRCRRPPTAGSL